MVVISQVVITCREAEVQVWWALVGGAGAGAGAGADAGGDAATVVGKWQK